MVSWWQADLGLEEVISGTAYLDLCLRTVTEPPFLRLFVRLLLEFKAEVGSSLLDVLISRISSTSRVSPT